MVAIGERQLKSPRGYLYMRIVGVDTQHADIAFSPIGDVLRVSVMTSDAILMQGVSDVIHAGDSTELASALHNLAEWLEDWHGRHIAESVINAIQMAKALPPA